MHPMKFLRWILPALAFTYLAAVAPAQIYITVTTAPPALPVYEQPPCPEEGWMWSHGYWAWDDDGYYWVPGEWVPAPYTGAMWTPPWWGWQNGRYLFHEGYWGNEVGYYGGIDYGYGYMGEGFSGGEWRDGRFAYNTAVMRVNPTVIRNTYVNETIVRERTIPNERHVAYNGGPNGIRHEPSPIERRATDSGGTVGSLIVCEGEWRPSAESCCGETGGWRKGRRYFACARSSEGRDPYGAVTAIAGIQE